MRALVWLAEGFTAIAEKMNGGKTERNLHVGVARTPFEGTILWRFAALLVELVQQGFATGLLAFGTDIQCFRSAALAQVSDTLNQRCRQ